MPCPYGVSTTQGYSVSRGSERARAETGAQSGRLPAVMGNADLVGPAFCHELTASVEVVPAVRLRHEEEDHVRGAEGDEFCGTSLIHQLLGIALDEGISFDPGEMLVNEEGTPGIPEVPYFVPVEILAGALATVRLGPDLDSIIRVEEDQLAAPCEVLESKEVVNSLI
jgi:hypothetical protein